MKVTLVEKYNPEWPSWFATIREAVEPALGDSCLAIEHVGSTSVPGLTAKPIIDIDIVITEGDLHIVKEKLAEIGYVHEGDLGIHGREAFDLVAEDLRARLPAHHLYVCAQNGFELRKHIAFRDFLRRNPEQAERLSQLKWSLVGKHANDKQAYIDGKSALVQEITALALADSFALIEIWKQEAQRPFAGWDFSYLDGRMLEEQPPWSYMALAAELMRQSTSALDMGTGGGERLLALKEHWPHRVTVTEDYPPNLKLATERLALLGVQVRACALAECAPMPFADAEFDLVLNRHSCFNGGEVARILAPGGTFLTQQIHGLWAQDLLATFGAEPQWPDETLASNVAKLQAAGLTVVQAEEWSGELVFTEVGAIVYYLKAVPWLVPGFSVDRHPDTLLTLHSRLERGEGLVFQAKKYLIEARHGEHQAQTGVGDD
jgi:GrpB-like predicted nucleotidyltransferase (UPF0157 family)/SAM-dependent methyltransferase